MALSVVCQAQPLTSISDIAHAHGYAESNLPSDEKQGRLNGCQLTTTIIESISWPWLYANHLLVDYELILTSKNTPLSSTSYSWLPAEMVVAVGWLLKSYFYIYTSSLNSIAQKELCQVHPLAAIITMPGSGSDQPQHPPSESSGQQAQGATACPAGSFNSFLYSDSAGGSGGSQQHQHTLGLDCFVSPCHGVCQFRPSSDSSGPAEWQMDSIARRAVPTDNDVTMESDPCPICLDHFHGRDEAPVVVKSQCCDQRFDLNCISKCFVEQPIGYRRCAMCRQDPMPMVDENTSESHPDKFFPDQAFYLACFQGDLDQVEKSLAEGVNVNVGIYDDFTALILASCKGHKDVAKRLIDVGVNINARTKYGATALYMAAHENNSDCVKILIEAKADLNARSKNGATPLYIAAREGHTDIVKLLIEAGADLNAALPNGANPLFIAARKGHTDIVKLLIEAGA